MANPVLLTLESVLNLTSTLLPVDSMVVELGFLLQYVPRVWDDVSSPV